MHTCGLAPRAAALHFFLVLQKQGAYAHPRALQYFTSVRFWGAPIGVDEVRWDHRVHVGWSSKDNTA